MHADALALFVAAALALAGFETLALRVAVPEAGLEALVLADGVAAFDLLALEDGLAGGFEGLADRVRL